jgi:hypothetical protein
MESAIHRVQKVDVSIEKFTRDEIRDFAVVNITTWSRLSARNDDLVRNQLQLFIDDLEQLDGIIKAFETSNIETTNTTFDENGTPNTVVEQ